jgi:hypothetical protein
MKDERYLALREQYYTNNQSLSGLDLTVQDTLEFAERLAKENPQSRGERAVMWIFAALVFFAIGAMVLYGYINGGL